MMNKTARLLVLLCLFSSAVAGLTVPQELKDAPPGVYPDKAFESGEFWVKVGEELSQDDQNLRIQAWCSGAPPDGKCRAEDTMKTSSSAYNLQYEQSYSTEKTEIKRTGGSTYFRVDMKENTFRSLSEDADSYHIRIYNKNSDEPVLVFKDAMEIVSGEQDVEKIDQDETAWGSTSYNLYDKGENLEVHYPLVGKTPSGDITLNNYVFTDGWFEKYASIPITPSSSEKVEHQGELEWGIVGKEDYKKYTYEIDKSQLIEPELSELALTWHPPYELSTAWSVGGWQEARIIVKREYSSLKDLSATQSAPKGIKGLIPPFAGKRPRTIVFIARENEAGKRQSLGMGVYVGGELVSAESAGTASGERQFSMQTVRVKDNGGKVCVANKCFSIPGDSGKIYGLKVGIRYAKGIPPEPTGGTTVIDVPLKPSSNKNILELMEANPSKPQIDEFIGGDPFPETFDDDLSFEYDGDTSGGSTGGGADEDGGQEATGGDGDSAIRGPGEISSLTSYNATINGYQASEWISSSSMDVGRLRFAVNNSGIASLDQQGRKVANGTHEGFKYDVTLIPESNGVVNLTLSGRYETAGKTKFFRASRAITITSMEAISGQRTVSFINGHSRHSSRVILSIGNVDTEGGNTVMTGYVKNEILDGLGLSMDLRIIARSGEETASKIVSPEPGSGKNQISLTIQGTDQAEVWMRQDSGGPSASLCQDCEETEVIEVNPQNSRDSGTQENEETDGEQKNNQEKDSQQSDTDSGEQVQTSVGLSTTSVSPGESLEITVDASQTFTDQSYNIITSGPTDLKNFNGISSSPAERTLNIPEDAETGSYTVKVKTGSNIAEAFWNTLTGKNWPKKTFQVTANQQSYDEAWKTYCSNQGYNMEQIDQQSQCIKNDIVPSYFQDSTGPNPEVAESLCQDLLGYSYSEQQHKCVP